MGTPRASKLPDTSQFPKITGSTAKILVFLYKNMLKIKKLGSDDPVIDKAVALDMQTAEIKKQLKSTTPLNQVSEAITVSVNQLKSVSSDHKAIALAHEGTLNDLKGKMQELLSQREALSKRYTELVDEQLKIMGNLLVSDSSSKDQILNKINEFEGKRKQVAEDVKNYSRKHDEVQTKLDSLYSTVYNQAPDKSKLPTPSAATPETPGAGAARTR